jgi:hypothetical protein
VFSAALQQRIKYLLQTSKKGRFCKKIKVLDRRHVPQFPILAEPPQSPHLQGMSAPVEAAISAARGLY